MADEIQRCQMQCYAMHMTHKRKPLLSSYKMNISFLQTVTKHTYLGVEINNKLNWAEHISISTSKANKVIGLLRRNLFSCSAKVKETAYKTLVRPKLEYCATKINWKLSNAEQPDSCVKILDAKVVFHP